MCISCLPWAVGLYILYLVDAFHWDLKMSQICYIQNWMHFSSFLSSQKHRFSSLFFRFHWVMTLSVHIKSWKCGTILTSSPWWYQMYEQVLIFLIKVLEYVFPTSTHCFSLHTITLYRAFIFVCFWLIFNLLSFLRALIYYEHTDCHSLPFPQPCSDFALLLE